MPTNTVETVTAIEPPEPDAEQVERFVRGIFKHATVGGYVSIRAFLPEEDNGRALFVRTFEITGDLKYLIKGAINNAREAAKCGAVFSPPACTFTTYYRAYEKDVAEGLVLSVDSDKSYPRKALEILTSLLGSPTFVVASGGRWLNPDTGEYEDKLHLHWRLAVPARDVEALKKLKHARKLAAVIVGADTSNVPTNHPIRWAGSWHLKAEPRLCRITQDNDTEIDLDAAFNALKAAAPANADVAEPSYGGAVDFEKAGKSNKDRNHYQIFGAEVTRGGKNSGRIDTDMLIELMPYVPNPDFEYGDWNSHGMAIWRAAGAPESQVQFDLGYKLFDEFSKKSEAKYHARKTMMRWYAYKYSPPNRTGGNKLAKIARANGWKTAPTHAVVKGFSIDEARAMTRREVLHFLYPNHWQTFGDEFIPTVNAIRVGTGIGKSTAAIEAIAKFDPEVFHAIAKGSVKLVGLFHWATPTLKLADEHAGKLQALGRNVRVARGRKADDPDCPGEFMCLEPEKVDLAVAEKVDVTEACCRNGDDMCPAFDRCGYQRQWRDRDGLDGWLFASDTVFHRNDALETPDFIIFDESFWTKQLRGTERDDIEVPRDRIELPLSFAGKELGKILDAQPDDGPLKRRYARYADYSVERKPKNAPLGPSRKSRPEFHGFLDELKQRLYDELPDIPFSPSMNANQLKAFFKQYGAELKLTARIHVSVRVIEELIDMIDNEIELSGRLSLVRDPEGHRLLRWRGIETIKQQFKRRTLLLDAMLPPIEILRVAHPQANIVADINVEYDPAVVRVRQITEAPVSKEKLVGRPKKKKGTSATPKDESKVAASVKKHGQNIRRYILRRWVETGRGKALVIANKAFEDTLKGTLPPSIELAHFNAVAGLDSFGDVRLLIIVGRVPPKPLAVEAMAAALSGRMPEGLEPDDDPDDDFIWYPQVSRGIRMRDGTGVAVRADQHPDALCEAIRFQICEAEIMQAIGRARGVNRDASTPCDIDILNDLALPLTIDEHEIWEKPSRYITTAVDDGVMLEAPDHMVKGWPTLWPNRQAATRDLDNGRGIPTLPGFTRFRYKLKGRAQKWRYAWFDITKVADPSGWIDSRFGPSTVEVYP